MTWDYFNKFEQVNNQYLPDSGEGSTKATQICTAVNKLVYKWYNDGDVYDNTHYLTGWWNDLSSYANWLAKYAGAEDILTKIWNITSEDEYEELLAELADRLLDAEYLENMNKFPAEGSVYECEGDFIFEEQEDEDEEWW